LFATFGAPELTGIYQRGDGSGSLGRTTGSNLYGFRTWLGARLIPERVSALPHALKVVALAIERLARGLGYPGSDELFAPRVADGNDGSNRLRSAWEEYGASLKQFDPHKLALL
jgi:hypothetical protein